MCAPPPSLVWLEDIPVAVLKKDSAGATQAYYIQADHLNTPRVILNSANTPVWRWDNSDAFGQGLPEEDPDGDGQLFEYNLRFPGQYADKETGLNYNYFRDYDSATGRYIQSDLVGLKGGLNLYAYVDGNPLSYSDSLGLTKDKSFLDQLRDIFKYDPKSCSKRQPTFQTCMACCQADACRARGGTGNPCRIECIQTPYPDNPYGRGGL